MGRHDVESWLIPGNLGQESTRSPLDSDCWTFDWAPEMSEQSWQKSDVYPITMCLYCVYIYYSTNYVHHSSCIRTNMFESQRYMHRHKAIICGIHTGYIYVRTYVCWPAYRSRNHIWYIHSHASLDSSCQPPWGG